MPTYGTANTGFSSGYDVNMPSAGASTNYMPYLSAISAVSSAYSSYQQGKTQKYISRANAAIAESNARTQARIAQVNAKFAEMQARDAFKRGQEGEAISRMKVKKTIGAQRAAMAAQGIRVDEGSAQDIQQETQEIGALDVMTIRNNAMREAFGYETQARAETMKGQFATTQGAMQAAGLRMQGDWAYTAGRNQALETLLTGGMRTYDLYKRG